VREAADILSIGDLLKRKPKALSGGQRQRVAIGRAIVREPKVFLMDEPLSNLDAKLRNQMRAELIKIRQRVDTTFIYVTHDQTEAMTLGDRIVVMKDGYIQQIGTPQEVFNSPANLFVAGFIGTPQMNFFPAQLDKVNGKFVVKMFGAEFTVTDEQQKKLNSKDVQPGSVRWASGRSI
jgi:multiple sugar transport system ATP-binding protein